MACGIGSSPRRSRSSPRMAWRLCAPARWPRQPAARWAPSTRCIRTWTRSSWAAAHAGLCGTAGGIVPACGAPARPASAWPVCSGMRVAGQDGVCRRARHGGAGPGRHGSADGARGAARTAAPCCGGAGGRAGGLGGAGDGNRTHVCSLGSCRSTIELHPRGGERSAGKVRKEGKQSFFEKKTKKLLTPLSRASRRSPRQRSRKFFASFFQKRRRCFLDPPHRRSQTSASTS